VAEFEAMVDESGSIAGVIESSARRQLARIVSERVSRAAQGESFMF
jgi:hypothetical protein